MHITTFSAHTLHLKRSIFYIPIFHPSHAISRLSSASTAAATTATAATGGSSPGPGSSSHASSSPSHCSSSGRGTGSFQAQAQAVAAQVHAHVQEHEQASRHPPLTQPLRKPLTKIALQQQQQQQQKPLTKTVVQQQQQGAGLHHHHDQQLHGQSLGLLRGSLQALTPSSVTELSNQQVDMVELREAKLRHLCQEELQNQLSAVVQQASSAQQQQAVQPARPSPSSTVDAQQQIRPGDIKLFGQSLLSQPSLNVGPQSALHHAASSVNERGALHLSFYPTLLAPSSTVTKPSGAPSAFGRVQAPFMLPEGQQASWPTLGSHSGNMGLWSMMNGLQGAATSLTKSSEREARSQHAMQETMPHKNDCFAQDSWELEGEQAMGVLPLHLKHLEQLCSIQELRRNEGLAKMVPVSDQRGGGGAGPSSVVIVVSDANQDSRIDSDKRSDHSQGLSSSTGQMDCYRRGDLSLGLSGANRIDGERRKELSQGLNGANQIDDERRNELSQGGLSDPLMGSSNRATSESTGMQGAPSATSSQQMPHTVMDALIAIADWQNSRRVPGYGPSGSVPQQLLEQQVWENFFRREGNNNGGCESVKTNPVFGLPAPLATKAYLSGPEVLQQCVRGSSMYFTPQHVLSLAGQRVNNAGAWNNVNRLMHTTESQLQMPMLPTITPFHSCPANFGDHQDSAHSLDFPDELSLWTQFLRGGNFVGDSFAIDGEDESLDMLKLMCAGSPVKQNRTPDVHNLSERPRRDRIDEKMKSLQQFIPNSSKRCKVEQLGMVHRSSSKGNMEVMNYGVNENGDHYSSGMREAQVEDMDSEPENASEGYQSEANTILQPDGADDTFIFQATSSNSVNTQVFKERILTAICDLDDRTFGQNSKLQVNVLQCKYMVDTIVTSKCYLMGETCATLADPIYKELFRIVKKADLIVQECSGDPLNLKSILVEMDNICAFLAVIVDWQSCTTLFRKDIDNWTWASVHSTLEQLKAQDIQKNKELWDPRIAELRQSMSNAGGSRTGKRINLADYLQWRVQNVMNTNDIPPGLLPWCVLASDPEAKRGEFLGHGTFGSVSQYTWFGMACAEKSFNPFLCEKQERDFENEVGVMVRLNHPHVVRLICCHQDSTKSSIVMELMPTNLERHIAERKVSNKPFTPQAAVDVMSQIASGMKYLHGQGVVHRDLKPNNILVSPNTNPELSADGYVEVKLADFGLAKTKVNTSSSMLHSQICGAAPWRAPEAFEDHVGHRRRFSAKKADVYSFAILCSQILSGKLHPFGYPAVGLLERISSPKNERPFLPSNSNYPAQLLSLIKQCWAPDPRMRPNFSTICSSLQEIRFSLLVCKSDVN